MVEMLVVIAVIGIIAAIAIPNIGNVNAASRTSTARRNAQNIASTFTSALAAGYVPGSGITDVSSAVTAVGNGSISPTTGPFSGKLFVVPNLPSVGSQERIELEGFLTWDASNLVLGYAGGF